MLRNSVSFDLKIHDFPSHNTKDASVSLSPVAHLMLYQLVMECVLAVISKIALKCVVPNRSAAVIDCRLKVLLLLKHSAQQPRKQSITQREALNSQ